MTETPRDAVHQSAETEDQRREKARNIDAARRGADVDVFELIGTAPGPQDDRAPMEMSRRLMESINELRTEIVKFRKSSDRLGWILAWLTVIIAALTVVLVVRAV